MSSVPPYSTVKSSRSVARYRPASETEQAQVVLGHGHVERVLGEARTDQGQCRLRQQQRDGDRTVSPRYGAGSGAGGAAARRRTRGYRRRSRRRAGSCRYPVGSGSTVWSTPLSPLRTQLGEHHEADGERDVGEDDSPEQDVDRRQLARHVRADMTAAESTSPIPEAPGVGAKYSRNMTSVWTSRMSTKFACSPRVRRAT